MRYCVIKELTVISPIKWLVFKTILSGTKNDYSSTKTFDESNMFQAT